MINNQEINFLNMETPKDNRPTKEELQINKTDISKAINILLYLFLAPFLIIGFFAIECAKAAPGSGRRRR